MKNRRIRTFTSTSSSESSAVGARGAILRATILFAVLAAFLAGTVVANPQAAYAVEYPTWADVAAARNSEAAAKKQIEQIKALLIGLRAEAERTAEDARIKGDEYFEADQLFQAAAARTDELQKQADAAMAVADESNARASQMAAQLARPGRGDPTVGLMSNATDADNLLLSLEVSGKVAGQMATIYDRAIQDQNSAQSQADAAEASKVVRDQLRAEAEVKFLAAQEASVKAAAALQESEERSVLLEAQLVVLVENRAATESDYLAGERVRAAEAAAAGASYVSSSGWAKPASGWISSGFGNRVDPIYGGSRFHAGVDIAASCNNSIWAASTGTVTYAGWNGSYGNYVRIDHGGGISTAYGHIINGGIKVSHGQQVIAGSLIAKVGSTGKSSGCHLHFEVRQNGTAIDPRPFMSNRGVSLG